MRTLELWFFSVTGPDGKRYVPRYRMTADDARQRYLDPEPVPNSREVRLISSGPGHGALLGPPRLDGQ